MDRGLEQCLHHPGEGPLGDQTVLVAVRVGKDLHQKPVQFNILWVGHHGGLLDELKTEILVLRNARVSAQRERHFNLTIKLVRRIFCLALNATERM